MVGWLIWLSTHLLGNNEFTVRLPAFISWVIAALFLYRLTINLFDKSTAIRSLVLIVALPIFFTTGCFMTPDLPMYAAWSAALYFLERALLGQKRHAWYGVGISLGLGLLSKYTIGLMDIATLAFILIDRKSRRWLARPEPYLAAIMAAVIFSPVIIWNYNNDWASFFFQGPRRWSGDSKFSLHLLLGGALILLTPTGLVAVVKVPIKKNRPIPDSYAKAKPTGRNRLFLMIYTLIPLAVFIIFSLHSQLKLNWTEPVWIAALPLVAWDTAESGQEPL
nr:glycosyltransferase family 39 protein [candidate division Zixibacteria bacterium]